MQLKDNFMHYLLPTNNVEEKTNAKINSNYYIAHIYIANSKCLLMTI